jgi:hypothetical protein
MIKFSEFLLNEKDFLQDIEVELNSMSQKEINQFGEYLYDEYFDYGIEDESESEEDYEDMSDYEMIDKEEIMELLSSMSPEELEEISSDLQFDPDEIFEGVSMRQTKRNQNRRKFMKKSAAQMRKEKQARIKYNRKNKQKRKSYYKKNKNKIKSYQKSYNDNVKTGRHKKKVRKRA